MGNNFAPCLNRIDFACYYFLYKTSLVLDNSVFEHLYLSEWLIFLQRICQRNG